MQSSRYKKWETIVSAIILAGGAILTLISAYFPDWNVSKHFSMEHFTFVMAGAMIVLTINYVLITSPARMSKTYRKFGKDFDKAFTHALNAAIRKSKLEKIESLDIFARCGERYGAALHCFDKEIVKTRLLVASPSLLTQSGYSAFDAAAWNGLVSKVIKEKLNNYKKEYDFVPAFHFAIIKWQMVVLRNISD
jgi:hypothetical protein